MLQSVISSNAIIPYDTAVLVGLRILISLKEILLSSETWNT